MSKFSKRIAALTPEQRAVLELRLRQQGKAPLIGASTAISADEQAAELPPPRKPLAFSLFFFSGDGSRASDDKYRLLTEAARFADEHDFAAVWTPERHFQDFGGLYPNPSVLGAALAMITERVQIRAGSVALPLHSPVRVAEEWAVVDNLSRGRAGIALASGWHSRDFVLAPAAYEQRRALMFEQIALIQRLWAGETVALPGVHGDPVELSVLPRPIQPRLPVWITTTGTIETWRRAGEIGANVLATLINQSLDDLRQRIALYRTTRAEHGHDPDQGQVAVMLHTFVGDDNDAIKAQVRAPLLDYLRTFLAQFRTLMAHDLGVDLAQIAEQDQAVILAFAFERYFERSSLLGTPEKCARLLDHLGALGVNEIACLIDFGLEPDLVLAGLHHLDQLRALYRPEALRTEG